MNTTPIPIIGSGEGVPPGLYRNLGAAKSANTGQMSLNIAFLPLHQRRAIWIQEPVQHVLQWESMDLACCCWHSKFQPRKIG